LLHFVLLELGVAAADERWRSAARDKQPSHSDWLHREPAASRCSGRTIHSERPSITRSRKSTRALGSHANTDRPPLDEVAAVDEGDDRFTSGGPANTACYRRLDSTPTSLRPESWFAISLPARPSNPAAISISIFSRVETARSRKRGDRFTPSGRENAQNARHLRRRLAVRSMPLFEFSSPALPQCGLDGS
jgi:hypothetical protein